MLTHVRTIQFTQGPEMQFWSFLGLTDPNQPSCQTQCCYKTGVWVGGRCSCVSKLPNYICLNRGNVSVACSRPAHIIWTEFARQITIIYLKKPGHGLSHSEQKPSQDHPSFFKMVLDQFKLKSSPDALSSFKVHLALLHTSQFRGSIWLPHHKNGIAFIKSTGHISCTSS